MPLEWQKYRLSYRTSTKELAAIANQTHPGMLLLYHRANPGCDQVGAHRGDSGSEAETISEIGVAAVAEVADDYLWMFKDGELVGLFAMEVVESWAEVISEN